MVNFRRQTSHASSTPWIIALSGSFLFSTSLRLVTVKEHAVGMTRNQRSFAFAQDDKRLSSLDQTAFSEVAEITTRGTLDQVDGELQKTNFPRIVDALDNRAERFIFIFDISQIGYGKGACGGHDT